jgi:hypothetical protein
VSISTGSTDAGSRSGGVSPGPGTGGHGHTPHWTCDEDRRARARASFAQRCAYAQFATADAATPLGLDDLEKLALAAYLTGHEEESTLAWTRAHHEAIRGDDPQRAARNAFLIGSGLMFRGETAPGLGWFARGGRVLEGCGECAEQAWPRIWNAFAQMWGGDAEGARPAFAESAMVGKRYNDADLLTMSHLGQGMCLVMQGQGPAGIAMLDEVMVAVTSGELSPMYAGITYCTVIAGCSELFDLRRPGSGRPHSPAGATPNPTLSPIGATAWSTDAS